MKRFLFGLIIAFISACSGSDKSEGVLNHNDMVKVLSEIYIAEDRVQRLSLKADSADQVFEAFRGKIESKTGIPDSVFRKSLQYYYNHPKEMEMIYTALVDSLSLREQRSSFGKE
jgi:hypothetical protein